MNMKIGMLQGNFRSAFDESDPQIRQNANIVSNFGPGDIRFNQDLLLKLARQAAKDGAELVISPESYLDGWSCRKDIMELTATTIPGPETEELCALAVELKIWMCVGLFEKSDNRILNSSLLISSEGRIVGVYRKTHETMAVLEKMPYDLGNELKIIETPWGPASILICHDRWYPENARAVALAGAKFVLNPVATGVFAHNHKYFSIHRAVLRSQAYLNTLFWISCNGANHGGGSLIMDPGGNVAAEGTQAEEVLVVHCDIENNQGYDFISNLRQDTYSNVVTV